jgi:hypothetical protein
LTGIGLRNGKFLKSAPFVLGNKNKRPLPTFTESKFQGIRKTTLGRVVENESIDYHVDQKFSSTGAGRNQIAIIEPFDLAIDPNTLKSSTLKVWQLLAKDGRLGGHQRGKKHDTTTGRLLQDTVDAIVKRAASDETAILRTMREPDGRP